MGTAPTAVDVCGAERDAGAEQVTPSELLSALAAVEVRSPLGQASRGTRRITYLGADE
jgi:hypothetical protein